MKKRLLGIILTVLMIISLLPVTAFAGGEEPGNNDGEGTSYTITNNAPQSAKDENNGYVIAPETAKAGELVTVTFYPNEEYKLKKLAYGRDTSQSGGPSESDSAVPELDGSTIMTEITPKAADDCITSDSIPVLDGEAAGGIVEITESEPNVWEFIMPAYPINIYAAFKLKNPQWTDWEAFDSGKGLWSFNAVSALAGIFDEYEVSIHEEETHENLKQLKIASFGSGIFSENGFDLIIDWDTSKNLVTIDRQSTGLIMQPYNEELMIEDFNSYTFTSINPSIYDYETKTFYIPVIYYISLGHFGFDYETMDMVSDKLNYDSQDEGFYREFGTDDTSVTIINDEELYDAALVRATDSEGKTVAIYVGLEDGCTEIPDGEYIIDKSGNPGTVLQSSGVVNGSSVTYSFAGNRNSDNLITTPIWFFVSGKVTVSYDENVMTMDVDAKNSYGQDIDITIKKVFPPKHSITDATTDPNGKVSPDKALAEEGSVVTLSVIPNDGYRLKAGTLKAVYEDDGEKEVVLNQDPAEKNKFTFTMPTADVAVTADFEEAEDTFKAVWDSKNGTLSFFYDTKSHMGKGISVFDELPAEAASAEDWPYDSIRADVESVVIDESCADYTGLKSTAYMFSDMSFASDITGAENLKLDNVTNMGYMFLYFGSNNDSINSVPDVSAWNTGNVTNMSAVFIGYGFASSALDKVPDVSGWNTENVTDMSAMFANYGYWTETLDAVPDVEDWKTGNVTNMQEMFSGFGASSIELSKVPDISGWATENVTNMQRMFQYYASSSGELSDAPDVSGWNTEKVTAFNNIFLCYGCVSEKLEFVMDLSGWDLSAAETAGNMFGEAGASAASWKVSIPYMTGELKNSPDIWYGKNDTVSTGPLDGKQFTLTYPVSIDDNIQNGKVETSVASAEQGTTVEITAAADEGCILKEASLKATYNDGSKEQELELTQDPADKQKYSFIMPAEKVTVTAEFAKIAAQVIGLLDDTKTDYAALDEALDAAKYNEIVKLLVDIPESAADIKVAQGVILDLNHHVLKTTGKVVNNGGISLYQENADIIDYMLYNVKGMYQAGEELKLPNADAPDYIVPQGSVVSADSGKDPAYQELEFAIGDEPLVWNADVPAGMQLGVAYALALGGDILGAEDSSVKTTNVTATRVTLNDNITIGNNDPDAGDAVLFIESLHDDTFGDDIGTFNANGKKITLNETGKLIVSSDVDFDESVLISGVSGKQICKYEDQDSGTVTYYAGFMGYEIIEGADSEWTKDSSEGLLITSNAPFAKFESVKVDGSTIGAANYKAEEGSTEITLAPAYLQTLSTGKHSIEIVSNDGSAKTNFTIKANTPGTGDNSSMSLWIALAVIAVAGLCLCLMAVKQKRNER